jgi:hypothetical protein
MKTMKNLFSSICILLFSTSLTAQVVNSGSCKSKASLLSGKESGKIQITLPESVVKENVDEYGKYYLKMFTIGFDEKSHLATFNMVTNDENSRRVIIRFLSANQIQSIVVENKIFTLGDFYENFLK